MTAIAGWIGAQALPPDGRCQALLAGQHAYGATPPEYRSLGDAVFGRSLFAVLPEDERDRGPLMDKRTLLVADIRIDNRDELAAALGRGPGRSQSDSDLLLQAWSRWQEACLDRLVGDFAFAIWDAERRKLTLARDPTGQRPLFFAVTDQAIAFSSTPAGLLNCPDLAIKFAYPRLAASMIGFPHLQPDTLFKGIERVLPGHIATWDGAKVEQRPYWAPPKDELRLQPDEYVEAYRHHLDTAVSSRLRRRSGSLGAHLSAGYDSSAVAATAALLSPETRPIAFTCAPRAGFDGPVPAGRLADESGIAGIAAKRAKTDHVIVRPSRGVLADLRRNARLYQDPALNLVNMEWWTEILRQARDRGVSTMLVGVMGNLSLNASGLSILPQWIRQRDFGTWLAQARSAAARPDVRWRGVLYNSFSEWLPAALSDRLQSLFRGIPSAREQSFFREEWWASLPVDPIPPSQPGERYPDRLAALRMLDVGLLRKGALADTGIDERDATADRLPRELLDLQLRGLQGADWYERFDKAKAQEIAEELAACHSASELLDMPRIRRTIDQWPSEGTADPRTTVLFRMRLLMALSMGAFLQEFEGEVSG
jgi:asparagine synthase (glutamine-hydrolysing)